jgi:AAA domain
MIDDAERLASLKQASVVAAAGCGKTELIARAVASLQTRQLVLTHTNAGVEAIQRRLRRFGVGRDRASVDTIDGWCLKYLSAYPTLSGGCPMTTAGNINWVQLRAAMTAFLAERVASTVVDASYCGVFVDEYQDTDSGQHAVITRLAAQLPVRILGDPLQAVFGFDGNLPSWDQEIQATFPTAFSVTYPWRWKKPGANMDLGAWLGEVRDTLVAGKPATLRDPRILFSELKSTNSWHEQAKDACFAAAQRGGTVVAICKWPSDSHVLARMTGGLFQCVEPIRAKEASALLQSLEQADGARRCVLLLDFFGELSVYATDAIGDLKHALDTDTSVGTGLVETMDRLRIVRDGGDAAAMAAALHGLERLAGVKIFRRELFWATLDALTDAFGTPGLDFVDALRKRRTLSSHTGRRLARCCVGSTLLVKGMEFDHAVVVHAGGQKGFTLNDIYVAFTRGVKSLSVLSTTDTIDPGRLPLT